MANFIFTSAEAALVAATLDLSTGNYYAHLVTTIPSVSNTVVSNLVLPSVPGYTSVSLTGLSYNATRWTFNQFGFPLFAFSTAPKGVVICKRAGASPAPTDQLICYSDFHNSSNLVVNLTTGNYLVSIAFGSLGAINFDYRYQYQSGAFDPLAPGISPGLIRLIATKNNTVGFSNPFIATTTVSPSSALDNTDNSTATLAANTLSSGYNMWDFQNRLIRPSIIGIRATLLSGIPPTLNFWGANNLSAFNSTTGNNNSFWTLLNTTPVTASNGWTFISTTNTTFWRYLRISMAASGNATYQLGEIELYNSTALSPTANFV